jgi:hypothetical protein
MTSDQLTDKTPYDTPWLGSLLRPALIATLIGCIDVAILSMLLRLYPGLANGYAQVVTTISLLGVLLGCATTTWLAQPGKRELRRPVFRLAEFLFLLVLARLLVWLTLGGFPGINQLLYQPVSTLLDGPFIFAAIVISLSWLFASDLTADMLRLALQPDELFAIEEDRIGELIRTSSSDRPAVLQRLVSRWVAGGILLVLIAASVRIERPDVGFLAIGRQNIDPTIIAAVVIYFLAGLLLVSHGQLAMLRTRWLLDRVPTSEQVLGQWPLYVGGLLLAIGLLALLLPFGGTFYLAQILSAILTFFFNAIYGVFQFFMGLLLLLVAALAGEQPEAPPAAPPPPPPAPPITEALPQAGGLPDWAGGALFWVIMAIFLGYAAYIYLSDKGIQFTWLRAFWQLLRTRWQALLGGYQQWQQNRLRDGATAATLEQPQPGRWFRRQRPWQQLDPTQQVRYFYLDMVERAATIATARTPGETPTHYAQRLRAYLALSRVEDRAADDAAATSAPADPPAAPEITSDVEELTAAFVQTRYAKRTMSQREATSLSTVWQHILDHLRRTKQP